VAAAKPTTPQEGRGRSLRLSRGDLLISSDNTFGPGKLVARDDDKLVLEYFDSPGQAETERYRESVSRASLTRLKLSPELRVFWIDTEGRWRSGRIKETNEHNDIYVIGHEWQGFVTEAKLFVRWDRPLSDPVGFGEAGLLESPLLAEMRLPFLQSILRQRSATHGMRAAISSCIELHEHQVETAWRVLQDPVQRYLLADEVGLGKTIEAGMVIRQNLLDNPRLQVQLVLPPFLVEQWRRELSQKFRIHDFSRAQIRFGRDDEPEDWRPADMLVVDEAHNLARLSVSDDPVLAGRFERLAEVAIASPRLLLLSATPALHNEDAFLAMLKMLDPAVYGAATPAELRLRLEARAGLGRIFLGLQPGLPRVLLKGRLAEIKAEFPVDEELAEILIRAGEAVDAQDRGGIATEIRALRTHVSEVYRVHRRMLRTRRDAALEGSYRVAGRTVPEALALDSAVDQNVTELLDRWREQALAAAEGDSDALRAAGRALAQAVSLSLDPEALRNWAEDRSCAHIDKDERTALERVDRDLAFVERRDAVSRPLADAMGYLFKAKERVVLFCPTTESAAEIADELVELFGGKAVFRHLASEPADRTEGAVRRFEQLHTAAVLVADASAEEGRNLQFADVLVHVGLPAEANRLEQRIGRFDRWAAEGSVSWRSYVVAENSDSFAGAWRRIVTDGFGIFDTSVASLQHAVDEATDVAWVTLLMHGVAGADEAIGRVREMLDAAIGMVREQDALDVLETNADQRSVYARMVDVESEAGEFADVTDKLLSAKRVPGNLRFDPIGKPATDLGGYEIIGRLPGKQAQIPLIPAWRLLRDFMPLQGHRGTFSRSVAIEKDDVHLYRYGDQFIDAVSDFLWHDDRGRAFGMWRCLPDWRRDDTPIYRFDYAVEANPLEVSTASDPRSEIAKVSQGKDQLSLSRRVDGMFPPIIVTVWMTANAKELTSKVYLDALSAPYAKPRPAVQGGDYALNRTRIEQAYELMSPADWGSSWREAEAAAQRLVRRREDIRDAIARGLAIAASDATTRLSQLRLRATRSSGAELELLEEEINREEVITRAMAAAIEFPTLRLDSTGIVVLSGRSLG
jgi:ATP-dependent helicase HepA